MGFLIFLVIIVLLAGFVFINIKIGQLKYRAEQHILKDSGISSSDISTSVTANVEKKQLQNFLAEYPNYTEESIKSLLKQYTEQLIQKNMGNEFSQTVSEKMQKDTKLEQIQNMQFKRINITHYGNAKLNAMVVYTDNKDEYNIYLYCTVLEGRIQLDKYQTMKGAVVGF